MNLRTYVMCCKIKPSFSSYWHDLSLSYYYQAKFDENNNHDLILKAQKCILHAINLNNNNPTFWNLLGVLYISESTRSFEKTHLIKIILNFIISRNSTI